MRALAALVLLAACGGGAKELMETAELEEVQKNTVHARELYTEVTRRYPGSPEAAKATERLQALDGAK